MDATAAPDDARPGPVPRADVRAPQRRTAGVAPHRERPVDVPERFAAAPRYPAMFHVAGGRLVWDGNRLVHVRGDGTPAPATGRPVVTVTGAGPTRPTVVVSWPAPSGDRARGPAGARPARVVLLDRSADRFVRFARALEDARPDVLTLDDRTVPSPRVPRLRPGRRGSERRPSVFVRAVWRAWAAAVPRGAVTGEERGGGDVVDRLERLAALHRGGALTDAEYARAKQRLLG